MTLKLCVCCLSGKDVNVSVLTCKDDSKDNDDEPWKAEKKNLFYAHLKV